MEGFRPVTARVVRVEEDLLEIVVFDNVTRKHRVIQKEVKVGGFVDVDRLYIDLADRK